MSLFGFLTGSNKKEAIAEALQDGAQIVDVRSPGEYSQGHAKGSINIPLGSVAANIDRFKSMKGPVVMCCASGMRSGSAVSMLRKHDIECVNAGGWTNLP